MFGFSFKEALTPQARKLLFILLGVALALTVAHLLTHLPGTPPFPARLFNLDSELATGAVFSSGMLMGISLAAIMNGAVVQYPKRWMRRYWYIIATMFLYLSIDEYFSIHETYITRLTDIIGHWVYIYAVVGLLFVGVTLAGFWKGFRETPGFFGMLLIGLALIATGGLVFEALNFFVLCVRQTADILGLCHKTSFIEEFLEMAGMATILAGFVAYAQQQASESGWRLARRVALGGAEVWMAAVVSYLWILPTFEAAMGAQDAQASFEDGTLELTGYRVSSNVIQPGEDLNLRLYWRSKTGLPRDYNYFVAAHVVTRPDAELVAGQDIPLGGWLAWNTPAWIPGVTMRDVITIPLPDDLNTPRSYWILIRVFKPTEIDRKAGVVLETAIEVPIEATDRQQLSEDTFALLSLPALSSTPLSDVPQTDTFNFDNGFALLGYSLPDNAAAGEDLTLEFWWSSINDGTEDLVQFVHLFRVDGEDFTSFDRPPFGETFPTSDWVRGMQGHDTLTVPLPPDLPPGEYRIQTGLYNPATGVRVTVNGQNGEPLPDASIVLGTVTIE